VSSRSSPKSTVWRIIGANKRQMIRGRTRVKSLSLVRTIIAYMYADTACYEADMRFKRGSDRFILCVECSSLYGKSFIRCCATNEKFCLFVCCKTIPLPVW
jgi:hypothetical protein